MSAQGYLQVHVYTSRANLPLSGVSVAVSGRSENGGRTLFGFRFTDSSGNTDILRLSTPDLSDSLSPNQTVGFSDVDVAADLPGYERVLVEDVQIFPGITTLQDIQLLPLQVIPADWGNVQDFPIPPQTL